MSPSKGKDIYKVPPLMGFPHEMYCASHYTGKFTWASFYTCIANGKRVFVWAYDPDIDKGYYCCIMVYDSVDPAYYAEEAELQHMFARQHDDIHRPFSDVTQIPACPDPLILQAMIHQLTSKGKLSTGEEYEDEAHDQSRCS